MIPVQARSVATNSCGGSSARINPGWPSAAPIETVLHFVGPAVVQLLAHLASSSAELAWPVAVVAESPDDR